MYPVRSRIVPPTTYPGYTGLGFVTAGAADAKKKQEAAAVAAQAAVATTAAQATAAQQASGSNDPLCKVANATGLNLGQDLCNVGKMGGLENFLWIITRYGTSGQPAIPEPWNTWLTGDASLKWEQSDEYKAAIAFADHLRVESRDFINKWNDWLRTVKAARSQDWWKEVRNKSSAAATRTWTMVATGKQLLDRKAELEQVIKATTQKLFVPEAYKGKVLNKTLTPSGKIDIQVLDSDNKTILKDGLSKMEDAYAWVDEFIAKQAAAQGVQVQQDQQRNVAPGTVAPDGTVVPGAKAPMSTGAKVAIVGGGAAAALFAIMANR